MSHALSKTNFCTCCSFCLVHTLSSSPTKSSFALSISTPPQVLTWLSSLLGSLPCIPGFKKWPHLGTQSGYLGKCGFPSALAHYGSGGHYWWVSTMGNSNLGGRVRISSTATKRFFLRVTGRVWLIISKESSIDIPPCTFKFPGFPVLPPSHRGQWKNYFYLFQANLWSLSCPYFPSLLFHLFFLPKQFPTFKTKPTKILIPEYWTS